MMIMRHWNSNIYVMYKYVSESLQRRCQAKISNLAWIVLLRDTTKS